MCAHVYLLPRIKRLQGRLVARLPVVGRGCTAVAATATAAATAAVATVAAVAVAAVTAAAQ
jgi:hypothetical protein